MKVEVRKAGTKGELSAQRAQRQIPAVIYGGEKASIAILVGEKEFLKLQTAHKTNAVLTLKQKNGSDTVIVKSFQRHPVRHTITHVDFQRISLKQEIEVNVPVKDMGEAPGVKTQGGILEHILREVEVKCLPTAIPEVLQIDISKMEIGDTLHVKDLVAPSGVTILTDPEGILVTLGAPKVEEEEAPAVEGAEAAAEPEVIAKGKKEEGEGEAAEKGKGGAPEKAKEAPKK